ncbi:bifunctional adenosylcobinamide kinase/adenosylcobinamide-phosphate guanylyltransferase [Sinanaerobacter sp. ZZT-01]|uniref:bifunctional adenosylcobinamide kinase/adenosylcobinamide-phosphate guanylyltransferase n=1 Tax=Sinanaerobacter sp. ZZT-01 TaxID=3111540 RepID=UPI002D78D027|nr:bifunctional adenosylcobinamide kinase/adenosylcobinamide-phosphate guanylyltransferase [Sinanaerobacter sp. ZZT-01]WRR94660.1 bifunctional adenosylcobinamide kinase/adenosylcobinamide-phosphate guanylyltransferase [Sinanaerobacter sp. ZZT-01]
MAEVTLMTGGARSGKSLYGERLAKEAGKDKVLYIATAAVCDDEMKERVKKHRAQRPSEWITLEKFWEFDQLEKNRDFLNAEAVLIDCLGFMLNNIMYYCEIDWDHCPAEDMQRVEERMLFEVKRLISICRKHDKSLIGVTNEVGMGLVPAERSSRYYRDILGRANRCFAELADRVIFMVSGVPVQVKPQ